MKHGLDTDLAGLQNAVETAVAADQFKCPKCDESLTLANVAHIPARQVLTMKLESQSGAFSAKTIGGVITEFDKLLKMVAKDVGGNVHVFIDRIERTETSLEIGFLITAVASKGNG